MKKTRWIICAFILAICVLFLLYNKTTLISKTELTEQSSVLTNQSSQPESAKIIKNRQAQNMSAITTNQPGVVLATTSSANTNAIDSRILTLWQVPINFYGKVVDENSNAVEGATVGFGWSELPTEAGARSASTKSDAEGLFSLQGALGPNLSVSVSKEGYYAAHRGEASFTYSLGAANYKSDPQNPVIFNLRKKGQGEHLITSENGIRSTLAIPVSKDNIPVTIDFFQKRVSPSGQLEISQIKPPWREATNWSTSLSIPSGGFVETDEEFPFQAPQSGYQTTINIYFEKSDTHWITHFTKKYYIVFGQPQQYGLLQVESDLSQMTMFLGYAINPAGSRNLEPQ